MRLGHKLKIIHNSYSRIADESTQELGITGMQSFLLGYLSSHGDTPPCQHDIEKRFNIKHPTATGLLSRLCEKGYVEFAADRNDGRLKRIVITQAGRDAAEQTKSRLDGLDEWLSSSFTPEELTTFHGFLDRLVQKALASGDRCRDKEGD